MPGRFGAVTTADGGMVTDDRGLDLSSHGDRARSGSVVTRIGVQRLLMARPAVRVLVRVDLHPRGMRRHQTAGRSSTAEVVTAGGWLQIVTEDEIALTAEAAAVLARIVREQLNQPKATAAPAAARQTGAAN